MRATYQRNVFSRALEKVFSQLRVVWGDVVHVDFQEVISEIIMPLQRIPIKRILRFRCFQESYATQFGTQRTDYYSDIGNNTHTLVVIALVWIECIAWHHHLRLIFADYNSCISHFHSQTARHSIFVNSETSDTTWWEILVGWLGVGFVGR